MGEARWAARMLAAAAIASIATGGCSADRAGTSSVSEGGRGGASSAGGVSGGTGVAGTGGTGGADGTPGGTAGAGAGGNGAAGTGGGNPPPAGAAWIVDGGDGSSGHGSDGGMIRVVAQGAITVGASVPAPPARPEPPADAVVLDAAALAADTAVSGSIRVEGTLTVGGDGPVRTITSAAGDIFVSGTLRTGDGAGASRGLTLQAPAGTVYVAGTIDADGTAAGPAGGAITISAQRIVITGSVSASGADGTVGGDGAAVTLAARDLMFLGGAVRLHGGAGTTAGGRGGLLTIDTAGAVQALDLVDARGGAASDGIAGVSGAIRVGEQTPPSLVNVSVPLSARGGRGGTMGGSGGGITLEPQMGNLVIAGSVDFGGGDAAVQPGSGGTFLGHVGAAAGDSPVDGGDVSLTGSVSGNGGAVIRGGDGNGGVAGMVTIQPVSILGSLTLAAGALVSLDGGASGGTGVAGGGGHLFFTTSDGDLTMAGKLSLRGGDAPDAGGTGGLGGAVDIFSDANFDGIGGNLLIDKTGVIDASGGAGTIGGSARNDGNGGVASFPDEMEMIAVLINCDGRHGTTQNWLLNDGVIIARGGAANGSGGDIAYHGISPDGDSSPPSGSIDNAASGSGRPGDFAGE